MDSVKHISTKKPFSTGSHVPALPSSIIEPLWHQFEALIPERNVTHP